MNDALGDDIKVTPASKTVADFAMFLVQNDLSVERADRLDFPTSLVDFLAGKLRTATGVFLNGCRTC